MDITETKAAAHVFRETSRTDSRDRKHRENCSKCDAPIFTGIIDAFSDPVFVKDENLRFVLVNQAMCKITGLSRSQLVGKTGQDLFSARHTSIFSRVNEPAMSSGQAIVDEAEICDANGRTRTIRVTKTMFVSNHGERFEVGILTDQTDLKSAQLNLGLATQRLETLVQQDSLTNLLNRTAFEETLAKAIARANQSKNVFALLLLNINGFKRINDTQGHAKGDELIREVALRLAAAARSMDFVGRIGGDEFVLLAENNGDFEIGSLAQRISDSVAKPYLISSLEVRVSVSIGIARYPVDGSDGETLMRNADTAMYRSKHLCRAPYVFYDPQQTVATTRRYVLESQLMQDIPDGRISIAVQPIVSLGECNEIVGFEALARWNHPQIGPIPPDEFIALAEKLHLIAPLGESTMRQACEFIAASKQPDLYISVNVSSIQLQDKDFSSKVWKILEETGVRPQQLALELTESALAAPGAGDTLEQLRAAGISLFIDDFGVGYSNLTRLHQFSFTAIKVDRGFVSDIEKGGVAAAMVRTIVSLSVELGVYLIAEGIETSAQAEALTRLGIARGQGYLYGRPQHPSASVSQ